ncbi:MAG: hypothetical protein ACKVZ6_23790 [Kineosporiaceae bacterium]
MTPAPLARLPSVIQGGIHGGTGVVTSWRLANAVARTGQLGVVTGTGLDVLLARRLQDGDPGGHVRRAVADFPLPDVTRRVVERHLGPEGHDAVPYVPVLRPGVRPDAHRDELTVVGSFVEVWLAKEGHSGLVGVDLPEQLSTATPAAVYGAMLAGVDVVLVGAGIPGEIPDLLDELAEHRAGTVTVDVGGGPAAQATLDPTTLAPHDGLPPLRRPTFLAIVSSNVLAQDLGEESARPDGLVVEGPVAAIGLPFWLAGGYGEPQRVRAALEAGAAGIQVGTLFALARESGLPGPLREQLLERLRDGTLEVPTGATAEQPIATLGADLAGARRLDSEHWLHGGNADGWTAAEAVAWLLRDVGVPTTRAQPVSSGV